MLEQPLVATKLQPLSVPADALPRRRLIEKLDAVLKHRVTLVTAPGGFGKTWLLSDWASYHPTVIQCWISLDTYDNDESRLLLHLAESVRRSVPKAGDETVQAASDPNVGAPVVVDQLVVAMAGCSESIVVIFDDAHHLEDDRALAALDQLVTEMPPNAHVAFAGRRDPALPLAKWRLQGDLAEIRTEDLRCTLDESIQLVQDSLHVDLDPSTIEIFHDRTMGWIAGIRLAAATASRSNRVNTLVHAMPDVGALEGAYGAVGHYLVEEALDHLDEQDRQFLLDTSILENLSGGLCNAVTGRADSVMVLEGLAQSGTFTDVTDSTHGWYRYHDILRSTLRTLLHRQQPGREIKLHGRAAQWLHEHGHPVDAVPHAIASGRPELAGWWLVESTGRLLAAKQIDTLSILFEHIDEASDSLHPLVLACWCYPTLFGDRDAETIDRLLDRTYDALTSDEATLGTSEQWAMIPEPIHRSPSEFRLQIDAMITRRRGDIERATALRSATASNPTESGWVESVVGQMLFFEEAYSQASALLQPWNDYCFSPKNELRANRADVLTVEALIEHGRGNLALADEMANRALEQLASNGLTRLAMYANAALPAAWVAWERGELTLSNSMISAVLDRIERCGEVPYHVLSHMLLARNHWSLGDTEGANEHLARAAITRSGRAVEGHFAERITLESLRFALLRADRGGADVVFPGWRGRLERGATTMREFVLLARRAIAAGDDLGAVLASQPPGAEVTVVHEIELHKIRSLAALRNGDEATALTQLTAAMAIAVRTGHRQTFLDERAVFGVLIDNAAARSGLRLRVSGESGATVQDQTTTHSLLEPLTPREIDVLRLLPSHLSYREIADDLLVSQNTVKAHVRGIYRKLDAERRSEAVEAARALGLVD